jgi:hypothetical protein
MTLKHKQYILLAATVSLAFLLGSCGSAASNQSVIATSVALTVQAQDTQAAQYTPTSLALVPSIAPLASVPPLATKAPPTPPGPPGTSQYCTARATFVSETIPDGTIMSPGQIFTKVWHIQNTGTCAWNKTWKLVYVSGDLMGGATVFDFPQPASPGQTIDVPVVFTAPLVNGSYRGYWKFQSPWGYIFGDSGSGNSFWVDIVVGSGTPENNKTQTVYDVTAVTMHISRRCTGANTFWHIWADMSSNGPVKVKFNWRQSDGNGNNNIKVEFTSATTLTVDDGEWSQNTFTSSPNPRWVQIVTVSPTYHEWPKSELLYLCPH